MPVSMWISCDLELCDACVLVEPLVSVSDKGSRGPPSRLSRSWILVSLVSRLIVAVRRGELIVKSVVVSQLGSEVAEWKPFMKSYGGAFFGGATPNKDFSCLRFRPNRKFTSSFFNKYLIFFTGQIYNMAEPIHDEEMPDTTAGVEQRNGEIDENDRAEPITKTIRIVCIKSLTSDGKLTLIIKLPGSTETAASFEFTNEDHTLGNALRHIIMKK